MWQFKGVMRIFNLNLLKKMVVLLLEHKEKCVFILVFFCVSKFIF